VEIKVNSVNPVTLKEFIILRSKKLRKNLTSIKKESVHKNNKLKNQ